ncbi:sodium-coupled neutral amino acid transporter 7 isoform X2 [Rhipicephalus microplus]|uniref:sodium-coupled neutral amino acid transporter 7 isoform X2 n=1 Tax=Rhipicephalus microplus TaxID=6941 RepID=UPI003F6D8D94
MSLPVYELGARSQNEEVLSKEAFGAPVVFEVQLLPLRSTSPSRRDLKMSEPPTVKEIGEVASRSDATEGTGQMTTFSVALIMTTTALGAGLLHFPAAYNIAGGIIMATVLQLILVVSIGGTILTLAFCADVKKDRTYHGILLSMCGKKWRYASAVSVLLTCYGVCVTYLIVIGDQYDRNFCHTWYMAREFTITLTAAAIVLPLNMLQHIEFLKYASSLGLAAVIYPCVLTCIAYFTERRPDNLYIKVWPTNVRDVFLSTPVFCFAYLSHEVVISAYAAMRQRSLWNMARAIAICTAVLFVIYSTVGCFGYLTYGASVRPDIMEMFDATQAWVLVGLLALIFKMAVTYPLPAICARDAIEELYLELRGSPSENRKEERARKTKLSLAWFASTVGLAILPLDIGVAIKFLGCLAALNIFVFPGMCLLGYTQLKGAPTTHLQWHMLVGSLMVFAGAVLFVVVLLHIVLVELVSGHANHLCS